ncbi:MAG: long-chain-fatty-acid--CoA ligase [Candidatus Goldiibacteriota bacterium]
MTLNEIVRKAAEENGKKVFLKYNKDKKTFAETFVRIKAAAKGMQELGIKKGDKVAVLLINSPEFIYTYFGAVMAGAEVVPLNTFLRLDEIVYIMDDCKAKILVTSSDFNKVLSGFSKNRVQSLEYLVSINELSGIKHIKFNEMCKEGEPDEIKADENDTAVIIYTSGTTGRPKGAVLTHKNLVSNVEGAKTAIHIKKSDKFIIFLPMFHAFSFTVCVLLPYYMQVSLTIIKSIQPFSNILKAVAKDRISVFVAIPQVYNVLAGKKIPKFILWLNPIRICVSGAAPLSGEVLKKFEEKIKVPLLEGYGLSETSPVVSVNPLDKTRKQGSVGLPLPKVKVRIVDETGKETQTGETGEILVKGPNVMKGYFNKPEETNETIKDGWLYTGDIGKVDEDGYLYIVDRKKDLILVNGMNLYPREVEEILYMHSAVEEASVVGKKDELHGEVPVGVIKLKEGAAVSESELKKFCRQYIANFKVPHKFEFWEELPRTGTGKILKREIKRLINEK